MPPSATPGSTGQPHLLLIFADGGALHERNERFKQDDSPYADVKRADFLLLPEQVAQLVQRLYPKDQIDCPREARTLFTVGSSSGASFVERMEAAWTVEQYPLGMCRYERSEPPDKAGRFASKVRFQTMIAYHLGALARSRVDLTRPTTVAVISDDVQLVPVIADMRTAGMDVRYFWYTGGVSEDLNYFAERNKIPIERLEVASAERPKRGSALGRYDALVGRGS